MAFARCRRTCVVLAILTAAVSAAFLWPLLLRSQPAGQQLPALLDQPAQPSEDSDDPPSPFLPFEPQAQTKVEDGPPGVQLQVEEDRRPWNRTGVIGKDGANQCEMFRLKAGDYYGGGKPPNLCLRSYHDYISDHVRAHGLWGDCPALSTWWQQLTCPSDHPHCRKDTYMDIGANIGSCLVQMISRPDVKRALAFEPSPSNLFYLSSTILANPSLSEKVFLWPVGLGSARGTHNISEEPRNAGNSALDSEATRSSKVIGKVETFTLDDLLNVQNLPYVHLVKMDVQGYEVKVLRGAQGLLKSGVVNAWKFEASPNLLRVQKASVADLFNQFIETGYSLWGIDGGAPLTRQELRYQACFHFQEAEFVALRSHRSSRWSSMRREPQEKVIC